MVSASLCPKADELEKFALGNVPATAIDGLVKHLESCQSCFAKIKTVTSTDTLVDALGRARPLASGPVEAEVSRLIEKLSRMPAPRASTIALICASCGKGLRAKSELAGKKVKCPKCGEVVLVPADPKALPRPVTDPAQAATLAPVAPNTSSTGADTRADAAHAGDDEVAWDFLAPPQAPDEIGQLGQYRVLEVLGHGGMGVVFRAEDPGLQRIVALKALLPSLAPSPSAKKRFLREARTAASIKHDHIVTIFQVGEDRGAPFLAMEFLHGEPLDVYLRRRGKLPVAETLRIGREVAEGLAAAHEAGLIHRDIKPANIWLEQKPVAGGQWPVAGKGRPPAHARVKILDFGLARAADDQAGLTQTGAIVGTPSYMAPEQGRGEKVDARTDLFSLGCLLYVMSTGTLPFKGTDTISTLMSVATDPVKPPRTVNPEVPKLLSDLIERMLAKNPEDRPRSAQDVADALRSIQDRSGGAVVTKVLPSDSRSVGGGRTKSRRRLLVACGLAFVAAAAILAAAAIFYLPTKNGTIRVEIDDPDIEVVLTKNGATIKGADKHGDLVVTPGEHTFKVKRGDFEFETGKIVLKKGETVTVKVEYLDGKVQVATGDGKIIGEGVENTKPKPPSQDKGPWTPTPDQKAFIDGVALLPQNQQADAVRTKLLEVCGNANGGPRQPHPPTITFEPKEGLPTKFVYSRGYPVDSIWPIAALPSVKSVEISAAVFDYGPLTNLPLTDVKLRLILDDLTNESYLKSIETLKTVNGRTVDAYWAARDKVRKNIEAMKDKGPKLPVTARKQWLLEQFRILYPEVKEEDFTYDGKSFGSKPIIQDVTPLRGVGVESIGWEQAGPLSDLRQLSGTGLQSLHCGWACDVRDLSGLKGLPLKHLSIHGSMVFDLSPLAGMKLESFECFPRNDNHNGPFLLADLGPLKGMPLRKLNVNGSKVSDLKPLVGMSSLTELDVSYTPVTDLTPLKGLPLTKLNINPSGVTDIAPLAGMKLTTLHLAGLQIKDLSPLAGMELDHLSVPAFAPLSPVEKAKVKTIDLSLRLYFEADEKALRALNPDKINGQVAADFWKSIEKRRGEDADLVEKMAMTKIDPESLKSAFDSSLGGNMNSAFKIGEGKLIELSLETTVELKTPRNYAVVQAFPSLRKLTMKVTPTDLSPLLKLPNLEELECSPELLRDNLLVLRALPKLQTINGKPAKEVLGK